ncbi:MAG: hypothetical protein V1839_01665 [archaeon]
MAVATSLASAIPVADNLWDVPQGTATADSSLFNNFQSAGAEHWVQWQTVVTNTLDSFKLYPAYNNVGSSYGGTFNCFSLFTKDFSIGEFVLIYGRGIAAPYVFIDSKDTLLAQRTPASPIIAREF